MKKKMVKWWNVGNLFTKKFSENIGFGDIDIMFDHVGRLKEYHCNFKCNCDLIIYVSRLKHLNYM